MMSRVIYEKLLNGDSLSDEELEEGIDTFRTLAAKLSSVGPVFALAANEANRAFLQLYGYWSARKRESLVGCASTESAVLQVVLCPGCAATLPLENRGCPHCGYENNEEGRLLTVAELLACPGYPTPGAPRLNDVSPAFLRGLATILSSEGYRRQTGG